MSTAGRRASFRARHAGRARHWRPSRSSPSPRSAAAAAALVSQHVYGMDPCAWCVLQRLIFVVIGIVAVVGLLWRQRQPARSSCRSVGARCSDVAGVASALWQQLVASKSASCNLTLADRIVSGSGIDQMLPNGLRGACELRRCRGEPGRRALRALGGGALRAVRHRRPSGR